MMSVGVLSFRAVGMSSSEFGLLELMWNLRAIRKFNSKGVDLLAETYMTGAGAIETTVPFCCATAAAHHSSTKAVIATSLILTSYSPRAVFVAAVAGWFRACLMLSSISL